MNYLEEKHSVFGQEEEEPSQDEESAEEQDSQGGEEESSFDANKSEVSQDSQEDTTFEEEMSEDSDFVLDEETPPNEPIQVESLKPVGIQIQDNKDAIPDFLQAKPVDLDRKLPQRLKKPEYEPKEDGILLNISQPIFSTCYTGQETTCKSSRVWTDFKDFNLNQHPVLFMEFKRIPFFSDWFQWRRIHEIETWAFPLFCGSEASEINRSVYIHIRDSMIEAYYSQPRTYLSITECYNYLCYDVNDIIQIHQFLERYKLINERVTGPVLPKTIGSYNLHEIQRNKSQGVQDEIYIDLEPSKPLLSHCLSCQANVQLNSHYVCRKYADFKTCINCFVEGRFPCNTPSQYFQFVQGFPFTNSSAKSSTKPSTKNSLNKSLNPTPNIAAEEWTDEETLQLLQAIEGGENEWEKIASQVQSKTAQECLQHFISLPILEHVLEGDLHPVWRTIAGQASNPCITLLVTFTLAISPSLAAASASVILKDIASKVLTDSGDILKSDLNLNEWTRSATELGFDTGLGFASHFVSQERVRIISMISKLTELQIKLVEWKMSVLEELLLENQ